MDFQRVVNNLNNRNYGQFKIKNVPKSPKKIIHIDKNKDELITLIFDENERISSWSRLKNDTMTRANKITNANGHQSWQVKKYCEYHTIWSKEIPCFKQEQKPNIPANKDHYDDTFIRRGKFGQDIENQNDIRNWLDPISRYFRKN